MSNEQLTVNNEKRTIKKRKSLTLFFVIFYLLFCNCLLFGQTAERIERLLGQDQVSYRDAALLVLEAAGHIESAKQTSADDAFRFAMYRGWLPKGAEADNDARFNGISLLLMRSFGLKGGFMYSFAKNPRYSYRELVFKGVIQGKAYPKMPVSGDKLLFMINRILALEETEGNK